MNRRQVLQSLSASLGTLLALPDWANAWSPGSLNTLPRQPGLFTAEQSSLLAEVVATIIPDGKIPGARSLGVPMFIEKMLTDCYEKSAQTDFLDGLTAIDTLAKTGFGKSFTTIAPNERLALLTGFGQADKPEQKDFFSALKNLTVQGYTTSEYVMVNHLGYVMAPGHYYGCINA